LLFAPYTLSILHKFGEDGIPGQYGNRINAPHRCMAPLPLERSLSTSPSLKPKPFSGHRMRIQEERGVMIARVITAVFAEPGFRLEAIIKRSRLSRSQPSLAHRFGRSDNRFL
jgi:hypothetical protein